MKTENEIKNYIENHIIKIKGLDSKTNKTLFYDPIKKVTAPSLVGNCARGVRQFLEWFFDIQINPIASAKDFGIALKEIEGYTQIGYNIKSKEELSSIIAKYNHMSVVVFDKYLDNQHGHICVCLKIDGKKMFISDFLQNDVYGGPKLRNLFLEKNNESIIPKVSIWKATF